MTGVVFWSIFEIAADSRKLFEFEILHSTGAQIFLNPPNDSVEGIGGGAYAGGSKLLSGNCELREGGFENPFVELNATGCETIASDFLRENAVIVRCDGEPLGVPTKSVRSVPTLFEAWGGLVTGTEGNGPLEKNPDEDR